MWGWLQVSPLDDQHTVSLSNLSSSLDVRYTDASLNQLRALVEASPFCRQVRLTSIYNSLKIFRNASSLQELFDACSGGYPLLNNLDPPYIQFVGGGEVENPSLAWSGKFERHHRRRCDWTADLYCFTIMQVKCICKFNACVQVPIFTTWAGVRATFLERVAATTLVTVILGKAARRCSKAKPSLRSHCCQFLAFSRSRAHFSANQTFRLERWSAPEVRLTFRVIARMFVNGKATAASTWSNRIKTFLPSSSTVTSQATPELAWPLYRRVLDDRRE